MKFGDRGRLSTLHQRREAAVDQILRQRLFVVLKRQKARSGSIPNFETKAFCGFETTQIQEAFDENQRRLDVLSREIKNPNTFQGFNTQEIRTYKKINKDRTEVLKGSGHSQTGLPLVYEKVFPKMCKLVTFGSKTSTSLVNN